MRTVPVVCLAVLALFALGCPQRQEPESPPAQSAQAIEAGESVIAEFAANGMTCPSGYRARMGDRLTFTLTGAAENLGPNSVFVMVGPTTPQVVRGASPQRVDRPGSILFRLSPHAIEDYGQPTVLVRITNHKKPEIPRP